MLPSKDAGREPRPAPNLSFCSRGLGSRIFDADVRVRKRSFAAIAKDIGFLETQLRTRREARTTRLPGIEFDFGASCDLAMIEHVEKFLQQLKPHRRSFCSPLDRFGMEKCTAGNAGLVDLTPKGSWMVSERKLRRRALHRPKKLTDLLLRSTAAPIRCMT